MSVPTYTNTIDINTFKAPFMSAYEGALSGLWTNKVSYFNPINSMVTNYVGLAAATGMASWSTGGARQKQKPLPFKISLTSAAYENSVLYPRDDFNVDTLGMFANNINDLAQKAAWHNQWKLRDLLPTLNSVQSYDSLYDGSTTVNYFSTNHPYGFDNTGANPSGTQKNLVTSSDIPSLDVVTATAPTYYEAALILNDGITWMLKAYDLNGDPINQTMRNVTVVVGTGPYFSAFSGATSLATVQVSNEYGATAVTNPVAGFKAQGFNINIVFEPSLGGTSIYFLREDGSVKPLVIQQTKGIQTEALGPNSEFAAQNNQVMFGASHTIAVGGLLYQGALKATLS